MLELDEALAEVAGSCRPLGVEEVALSEAVGRVLAAPVDARVDLPPFDATAMDGWAVRSADIGSLPARILPLGTLAAGHVAAFSVGQNESLKVMTGAPMPAGADAVVPVEKATEGPGEVLLHEAPKPGAHVRRRGEVFSAGQRVLAAPNLMTPARIGVAAAAGFASLAVYRRPRAALLVTGEEIVPAGTAPGPGKIPNSNGPLLAAALARAGAVVTDLGVSGDVERELEEKIRKGLDAGADLLVTTGGVSAGDYDLVAAVLGKLGADLRFHKVAIRPAKPVLFARMSGALVFGLPGNPVSAAVGFDLFVLTALRALSGLPRSGPFRAALAAPARNPGGRLALLPGRLLREGVSVLVEPLPTKGSHDIVAHALADALLAVPRGATLAAGESVLVYPAGADTTL